MAESRFRIDGSATRAEWDDLAGRSRQSTCYALSAWLDAVRSDWRFGAIRKGDELRGAVLLLPDGAGGLALDDLVVYGGVLLAPLDHLPPAARSAEEFGATEAVAEWMGASFQRVSIALSPALDDLRPFLWHGYHDPDVSRRFVPDLRYTSFLDLASLANGPDEESALWAGMEGLRRRNIRQGRLAGAGIRLGAEPEMLLEFYRQRMAEQGREPDASTLRRMGAGIRALDGAGALVQATCASSAGEPLYSAVFGIQGNRAWYVFGAGKPERRDAWAGTLCFWEGFRALAERGVRTLDLEGVNSPRRGAFKLSFGGNLAPYFELHRSGEGR